MSSIINILEAATSYNDTWNGTFYFVATIALLIGAFWTYMQVFVKPLKKKGKKRLEENIIYKNSEDTIEESYKEDYVKKNKK